MDFTFGRDFLGPSPGRCGVSPLEGVARNEVRARGRLPPPNKETFVICIDICIYTIYIKEGSDDFNNRKESS